MQPNDHTFGGQAGVAAPEVMIAVNDEATGMLLDGLSHSPYWENSLLIVTEDDPQDGGEIIVTGLARVGTPVAVNMILAGTLGVIVLAILFDLLFYAVQ